MDTNIIIAILIGIAVGVIFGIRIYSIKKKGNLSCSDAIQRLMELYASNIVDILQDTILILKTNMEDYNSKEEYENAILEHAYMAIYNNASFFGIPSDIIELLDKDAIIRAIKFVFDTNKPMSFCSLDSETITKFSNIIDEKVVKVIGVGAQSTED